VPVVVWEEIKADQEVFSEGRVLVKGTRLQEPQIERKPKINRQSSDLEGKEKNKPSSRCGHPFLVCVAMTTFPENFQGGMVCLQQLHSNLVETVL